MAGNKGVVNLLQQILKTGASSGTYDAVLGACKVGSHNLVEHFQDICKTQTLRSGGENQAINLKVVSGSPGTCVVSMTVDKPHTNM